MVSSTLTELDISFVKFEHPKSFFDLFQPLLNPKCKIHTLKIRGCTITALEAKVLQYLLMKNRVIHTLDFSECVDHDKSFFSQFYMKFDGNSNCRFLDLSGCLPDLTNSIEVLGKAFITNTKLEQLNLSNNKIKYSAFGQFWIELKKNKSLK